MGKTVKSSEMDFSHCPVDTAKPATQVERIAASLRDVKASIYSNSLTAYVSECARVSAEPYPMVPNEDISIDQIGENWLALREGSQTPSKSTDFVNWSLYEDLQIKLAAAEHAVAQTQAELLKIKIERDMACSERNMALQALVKMLEVRVVEGRAEAAQAEADSPGARALNAIAVMQANRIR